MTRRRGRNNNNQELAEILKIRNIATNLKPLFLEMLKYFD